MKPSHEQRPSSNPSPNGRPIDRVWFLRDSAWHNAVWLFAPTNALEEARPVRVDWNFTLTGGRYFTDDRYAPLLETSKQLIALIRTRSLSTGLAQRASTVSGYFSYLRELVRWLTKRFHALCRSRCHGDLVVSALAERTSGYCTCGCWRQRRCRSTSTRSPTFIAFATSLMTGYRSTRFRAAAMGMLPSARRRDSALAFIT
ncbi:MAG: hypothetical protein IPJ48_16890 [Propionivibrio sp.]|uniref:Uncharacterized protein n=1 Tax=Candidatus Propionivibrio dominans TaxID=2954373 RepID=A0A9D7I9Y2_9RHOO|nr:hypothetical protein [Candidatus Propionivibrio dominans]